MWMWKQWDQRVHVWRQCCNKQKTQSLYICIYIYIYTMVRVNAWRVAYKNWVLSYLYHSINCSSYWALWFYLYTTIIKSIHTHICIYIYVMCIYIYIYILYIYIIYIKLDNRIYSYTVNVNLMLTGIELSEMIIYWKYALKFSVFEVIHYIMIFEKMNHLRNFTGFSIHLECWNALR